VPGVNLPTPIGLLPEKGVIGEILRQLPRMVLDEAETQTDPWTWLAKWVSENPVIHWNEGTVEMRNSECATLEKEGFKRMGTGIYSVDPATRRKATIFQGVREVRFNYHQHDPEKIIMRLIMDACWPDSFRRTFEAAASQRQALLRLVEVARGGGSISQSWRLKMQAAQMAGDQKMADHWADKVTASILKCEKGRKWLLEDKLEGLSAPPEMREVAKQKYEAGYATDVRRLGRKKADKKWKGADKSESPLEFKLATKGEKIATRLALGWLSAGDGFPGYCFISDKVLAIILGLTLPFRGLLPATDDADNQRGRKTIEDCRRDIGLEKGEMLITRVKNVDGGKWALLDEKGKEVGYFYQAGAFPPKLAG
jgi:hypothetical protein